MSELGPVSEAILDYVETTNGYISLFGLNNRVSRLTGTSHTMPWYFRRLCALAFEGRIKARVYRTGDQVSIQFRRLRDVELL